MKGWPLLVFGFHLPNIRGWGYLSKPVKTVEKRCDDISRERELDRPSTNDMDIIRFGNVFKATRFEQDRCIPWLLNRGEIFCGRVDLYLRARRGRDLSSGLNYKSDSEVIGLCLLLAGVKMISFATPSIRRAIEVDCSGWVDSKRFLRRVKRTAHH